MRVHASTLVWGYLQSPEEKVGWPEAEVIGGCWLFNVGAGN